MVEYWNRSVLGPMLGTSDGLWLDGMIRNTPNAAAPPNAAPCATSKAQRVRKSQTGRNMETSLYYGNYATPGVIQVEATFTMNELP